MGKAQIGCSFDTNRPRVSGREGRIPRIPFDSEYDECGGVYSAVALMTRLAVRAVATITNCGSSLFLVMVAPRDSVIATIMFLLCFFFCRQLIVSNALAEGDEIWQVDSLREGADRMSI